MIYMIGIKNLNIKGVKGNLNYETEKNKNNTNNTNKINDNNKSRNSVFMTGFGSLSKLINKKEELSKNTKQKKENKYTNKIHRFFVSSFFFFFLFYFLFLIHLYYFFFDLLF